jgi:hypothetical protein
MCVRGIDFDYDFSIRFYVFHFITVNRIDVPLYEQFHVMCTLSDIVFVTVNSN